MFILLSLKKGYGTKLHESTFQTLKPLLLYSAGAGISLGLYLLNWTAGIFFVAVFACALLLQFIIDTLKKNDTDYLMIIGCIIFFIPLLLVLPYVELSNGFDTAYYSLFHIAVLTISMAAIVIMRVISEFAVKMNLSRTVYLMYLSGIITVGIILTRLIFPGTIDTMIAQYYFIFTPHTGGQLTVAEAIPITSGQITAFFGLNYYYSFLGALVLIYYSVFQKKSDASSTLIVIWTAIIYLIMLAQSRWAYYYAINVAILTGVIGAYILNRVGWLNLTKIKITHIASAAIIVIIVGFIPLGSSVFDETLKYSKHGSMSAGFYEWYEAMTWMRYNTPDTGLDYYGTYQRPPAGEEYPYPETAYGVLSWWDYGHIITYWAHRIPNANPFQAGIGGGDNHADGVATFLTAQDEAESVRIINNLKARYVVTDGFMAYGIQSVFATWNNDKTIADPVLFGSKQSSPNDYYITGIRTREGLAQIPGLKSYKSMAGRLHILDGNTLKQYRLIHESPISPNALAGKTGIYGTEQQYKYAWNVLYSGSVEVTDSGYVKIFEFVSGVNIMGEATPNSEIVITLPIQTNIGRNFTYSQTTTTDSNGIYKFTVPYSTEGASPAGTNFDTKPTGGYTIYYDNSSTEVHVNEKGVINGGTVILI